MLNVPDVFTRGAMKALVQAQISAASMGYEKMGTGHLLCGLCRVSDELTQVAAASAALNSFSKVLLANHIKTCVAQDIREGKDETIDELLTTLQKLMR